MSTSLNWLGPAWRRSLAGGCGRTTRSLRVGARLLGGQIASRPAPAGRSRVRRQALGLTVAVVLVGGAVGTAVASTGPTGESGRDRGGRPASVDREHPAANEARSAVTVPEYRDDPAGWSAHRLAAQLTFAGVQMSDPASMVDVVRAGVGGVTLYGRPGPRLAAEIAAARAASPVAPFIASDEEGGEVQRLSAAIYPLPSAERMGTWSDAHLSAVAYDYGTRMRRLGVTMDFAPVADLATPGHYIALLHRSFSSDPDHVARAVTAWNAGLQRAGVLGVVKHWPGHGAAGNTHNGSATVPSLDILAGRDMRPFAAAFAAGAPAVMVGHLRVPGLTLGTEPASESPVALRYLRSEAGPATLILTDDLSMAAASASLGITPATAAVRALQAGADMALVAHGQVRTVIAAVEAAIASGALPRDRAIASARRILAVKQAAGLVT